MVRFTKSKSYDFAASERSILLIMFCSWWTVENANIIMAERQNLEWPPIFFISFLYDDFFLCCIVLSSCISGMIFKVMEVTYVKKECYACIKKYLQIIFLSNI